MRLLPVALLLTACADEEAGTCAAGDLAAGTAEAEVDGAAWEASGATWVWSGTSLQLNTETGGGWRLSIVLQTTADGTTVKDAVDAGSLPLDLSLHQGEGAWALVYPATGDSFGTNDGDGGTLTLSSVADGAAAACFSFTAGQSGGGSVTVADGMLHASELDL